jgi:hypothetical protein
MMNDVEGGSMYRNLPTPGQNSPPRQSGQKVVSWLNEMLKELHSYLEGKSRRQRFEEWVETSPHHVGGVECFVPF